MGDVIAGRYELVREVGRGGMGAVWLGQDRVLGREVALKQLTPVEAGGAPTSRAAREAQLAARLNHRSVVAVFDLVEDGDQPWLVMEYVPGTTLAGLVADEGPLSPDRAGHLLAPIADALHAAHQAGVVHRDVKPSNILVAPDGRVKLTDFGIARGTGGDMTLTQTGLVTGSPAYLSPEVASGQPATPASDVWGLGATLYFALTGEAPYDVGDNVLGALYRIVHEEPPRTHRAGRLEPVLAGAMTRDPARRWTMEDVRSGLLEPGEATAAMPPVAPAPTATLPLPPPPAAPPAAPPPPAPAPGLAAARDRPGPRTNRLLVAGAVVLVLLATGGALLLGLTSGDDEDAPAAATSGARAASPSTGSTERSPSPRPTASDSPSASATPTAEGIESFVTEYLSTAASNPEAAFAMLTPQFQAASGGLEGYRGWWDQVASIDKVNWIKPVPGDPPTVTYRYRYTMADGSQHTEEVSLTLAFEDGTYRIAGE